MNANIYRTLFQESGNWCVKLDWLRALERIDAFPVLDTELAAQQKKARLPKVKGAVGVVTINGPISQKYDYFMEYFGGASADMIGTQVEAFQQDPNVGAVLLDIHSPGGVSYGVFEAAAKIESMSQRHGGKPIVAIANSMACSAAFALMSAADQRYVTPSGDVGSVGVYCVHVDWSKWNENVGIKPTYIAVPDAKVDGNPDAPLSEEAKTELLESVQHTYSMFVNTLAKNYGLSAKVVKETFGGGRVFDSDKAKAAGMVEGVATFDEVVKGLMGSTNKPTGKSTLADDMRRRLSLKVKAG